MRVLSFAVVAAVLGSAQGQAALTCADVDSERECGQTACQGTSLRCQWTAGTAVAKATCKCPDVPCRTLTEPGACILHTCPGTEKACRWERDTAAGGVTAGVCNCPPPDAATCARLSQDQCMGVCPERPTAKCVWDTAADVCGCDCSSKVESCEDFASVKECLMSECPGVAGLNCTWVKDTEECTCPTQVECSSLTEAEKCIAHTCLDKEEACVWTRNPATGRGECACPPVQACKQLSKEKCGGECPERRDHECRWNNDADVCECDCEVEAKTCRDFATKATCLSNSCPDHPRFSCDWTDDMGCICANTCADIESEKMCTASICASGTALAECVWVGDACRCPA